MASQKDAFSYDSHDTVERLWYERPQQQGRSDLHGRIVHLHKTHSFPQLSLPYVCPEPVLVKRCVFSIEVARKVHRFSHLAQPQPAAACSNGGGAVVRGCPVNIRQRRRAIREGSALREQTAPTFQFPSCLSQACLVKSIVYAY